MSATNPKPHCPFQYRLRFFHKCRSPGTCDPGQIDRYQIQGSALESTCGVPIIAVLVRYRNDPESGLSRECQRAQFVPGRSPFAVKAVVVPAERVLEFMDQPLLQQPRLSDSQGRNLIGGPDVSPDGEVFVTPLEANGIAHLSNFCIILPWSERDCDHQRAHPQWEGGEPGALSPGGPSASGRGGEEWLGGGSVVRQLSSDGHARGNELHLVVQLLRRGEGEWQGRWFGFDIPHLVSRPFQVVSRATWVAMHAPAPPLLAAAPQQQQQQQPYSPRGQAASAVPSLYSPTARYAPGFGPMPSGLQSPAHAPSPGMLQQHQQMQQQQQPDYRVVGVGVTSPGCGAGPAGGDFGSMGGGGGGFVLGPAGAGPLLVGRTSAGGAGDHHRCSSNSGGSPHGQRGNRLRRRSCLSKDCSRDDDGSAGGAATVTTAAGTAAGGPARTPSSLSAADAATGCGGMPLGCPGDIRMQTASPCSLSSPPSQTAGMAPTIFAAAAGSAEAGSGTRGCSGSGAGSGAALGLAQASSAMLLDIQVADLPNGVEAQPFLVEEAMDGEGTPKRVRSNTTAPCPPAAYTSGNSSSNLATSSGAGAGGQLASLHQVQFQLQQQQQQQQAPLCRRYTSCSAAGDVASGFEAGPFTAGSNPCSGAMPYVARHSDCSSWSAGNTPSATPHPGAAEQQQLKMLRKQSTGLSATAPNSRLVAFAGPVFEPLMVGNAGSPGRCAPTITTGATGAVASPLAARSGASAVGGAGCRGSMSQLDALMAQLLNQPGALQEALDRMEEEDQQMREGPQQLGAEAEMGGL